MQKYAILYATYAEVYILQILHLYALPTLLTEFNPTSLIRTPSLRAQPPTHCSWDLRKN